MAGLSPVDLAGLSVPVIIGRVSSPFGPRVHPVTGEPETLHKGVDIAAPKGTVVLAAKAGAVERIVENDPLAGNFIVIRHDDGTRTRYLHLDKFLVKKPGLRVFNRTAIGTMGDTGRVTGVHLHFEVLDKNGAPVDPGPLWGLKAVVLAPERGAELENFPLPVLLLVVVAAVLMFSLGGKSHGLLT